TSPNELNTTLTPHSMIHGDAYFAYFNKIWGIPHLDENRHCDSGTSAWLALLLNRQQHFDLYARSARRAPLGQRVLQMAGQPREAANRSCPAVRQELPA